MPLPPLVRTLVEKKVEEFCKRKVPEDAQEQVRLSYKFRGNSVTIFENRAPWWEGMKEWSSLAIAQMRYDENGLFTMLTETIDGMNIGILSQQRV